MADGHVRMWRAADDRVLAIAGQTSDYAIEPRGEYVFGIVAGQPMRSWRGREQRLVAPGQLVAWDPTAAHRGTAVEGRPWTSRLIIIEAAGLDALAGDEEFLVASDVAFPDPVIDDTRLARAFVQLHLALEAPATRLERDGRLAEWLRALIDRSARTPDPSEVLTPHDKLALRRASDYLAEQPLANIGLDELAAAAGIGKFRLIRLFRQRTGLTPHALQLAHRIRHARRMLEGGQTIAAAAATTGFTDQSHLHRHFRRSLGFTPAAYQRRFHS